MTEHPRPTGPSGNLVLGNATEFLKSPLDFLKKTASYGDVAAFRLGPYRAYLVTSAEGVNEVLVKQGDKFVRDPIMRIASSSFLGDGVINAEGDAHRTQRKLMQPAFHHKRLEAYVTLMIDHTQRMIERWREAPEIAVNREIAELTLRIVCEALFKSDISADIAGVVEAVSYFEEVLGVDLRNPIPLPDWLPLPRKQHLRKGVGMLHKIISNMIRERRAAGPQDRQDVLSTLILATYDDGSQMPEDLIVDEMTTMIIAGHETSATVLTWIIYIINNYPEVGQKVVEELDRVLAGRVPELSDLPKLTYLDCLIKETLRVYPPGWLIGRTPTEDVTLGGYTIRKGELVYMSPFITQHDGRYFDDPEAFRPERWADGLEGRLPKGAYFPFSNGLHVCMGQQFALMEIKLIAAHLLERCQFERLDADPIEPEVLVTLHPSRMLKTRAVERVFA